MPNFTLWAHVGFTDVIGLFMLCLDRGPTQGVRQLSMSSTMCPLYSIDNSSQQCQLAHSFILAVLSMGPLMIFAHCCLMGPCGSIDIIGLFRLCLDHRPTQDYLQLFPAVPIGPFIYLGSSIHGPTHDICPLLLDGPMWVHRYDRSIYTMPRSWAYSRCSAALDEFNHGPTVNY